MLRFPLATRSLLTIAVLTFVSGAGAQSVLHLKANVLALPIRNFSVLAEKPLGDHASVGLGLRIMPKGSIPVRGIISSYLSATDTLAEDFLDNARTSNWAITPEARYYFGAGPQHGFYIAPYVRFGGMRLDYDYTYTEDDGTPHPIAFTGKVNSIGGGLLVGAQWNLTPRILLDWWILGATIGSANVSLNARTDLSSLTDEQRSEVEEAIEGVTISGNNLNATVTAGGASADGRLTVPGLRTGLSLGVRL